jgi:hypothetical protein
VNLQIAANGMALCKWGINIPSAKYSCRLKNKCKKIYSIAKLKSYSIAILELEILPKRKVSVILTLATELL